VLRDTWTLLPFVYVTNTVSFGWPSTLWAGFESRTMLPGRVIDGAAFPGAAGV
jgi:hypothetical protein